MGEQYKKYRFKNREKLLERSRKYYKDNINKYRLKAATYYKENKDRVLDYSRTPQGKFIEYKARAKRRGIEFNISRHLFSLIIKLPCHYCGANGTGLDRVDNSCGYTIDNIVPCCNMCNRMKNDRNVKEFIDRCIRISNNHGKY